MRTGRVIALTVAALALVAGDAAAQQVETANLTVQAQVIESGCTLTGASLNFGQYVAGQTEDMQSTANIKVDCSRDVELAFDDGGDFLDDKRGMASGSNRLNYNLFLNGPNAIVAGGMPGGTGFARNVLGSPTEQTVTIYGTLYGKQTVPAGSYTDTVTIQMTVQ